ncbi:hypothetical protein FAGAP_8433 [Fusarium agapanthi]|uniref:PD-(D/E)XK nuclease-like domain-containing protein n=1 Tax=Fusarium agapanthi TaxID=1803897 RepID=A0A9P5EA46_9HYPO|nr:hypothetical protein FAGAP_8433 [Fusarium agapanthi]
MPRKRARPNTEMVGSDDEGDAIDETPKASSRAWKKNAQDLSRGSTPSLVSSSAASGTSSPIKQLRYAATHDAGFATVPFVDNVHRLPPSLQKIPQELVNIGYGVAMLPQSMREELQSLGDFPEHAFYDSVEQPSQWRIPPVPLIRWLVSRAAECQRFSEGESSWNNDIHDSALKWVFRETEDVAMFDYRYWHPLALSIETKRQAEWEKALLQIATWHSAQWRALQFSTKVESIEFLAGVIVQGHSWYFVASTLEDGVSTLYHRVPLGSAETHFELFKLLKALQCLASWIKDKYWPAFRADILKLPAIE